METWKREALKARNAVVILVACPDCDAKPGERCLSPWKDRAKLEQEADELGLRRARFVGYIKPHFARVNAASRQKRDEFVAAVRCHLGGEP
jgi:hypothetical protein